MPSNPGHILDRLMVRAVNLNVVGTEYLRQFRARATRAG